MEPKHAIRRGNRSLRPPFWRTAAFGRGSESAQAKDRCQSRERSRPKACESERSHRPTAIERWSRSTPSGGATAHSGRRSGERRRTVRGSESAQAKDRCQSRERSRPKACESERSHRRAVGTSTQRDDRTFSRELLTHAEFCRMPLRGARARIHAGTGTAPTWPLSLPHINLLYTKHFYATDPVKRRSRRDLSPCVEHTGSHRIQYG